MMDITVGNKTYSMKHTLKVKEYRKINSVLNTLSDFAPALKENNTEKINEITSQLNKITVENWSFAEGIVKRCFEISDADFEELDNDVMLLLYSEIVQASRIPKKKIRNAIKLGIYNGADPEFLEETDAVIIVSKYNILKSLGAGYTMSNLDEEEWLDLLYLNVCFAADNYKQEIEKMKAQSESKVLYAS